jgi:hypothetical protein
VRAFTWCVDSSQLKQASHPCMLPAGRVVGQGETGLEGQQ